MSEYSRTDLQVLLSKAEEVFASEPQVLHLDEGKWILIGDTHGDYSSSRKALNYLLNESLVGVVFLGDYVDRGPFQLENIVALLEKKLENPKRIVLLRGNHETKSINHYYGFYEAVASSYDESVYERFNEVFAQMPYAAVVGADVICIHGGIAEGMEDIEQVMSIPKGEINPSSPIAIQVLWNDPREEITDFEESMRGEGIKYFGERPFDTFMKRNGFRLLVRSHEPQERGYRYYFREHLLNIFSCRYYDIRPAAVLLKGGSEEILDLS